MASSITGKFWAAGSDSSSDDSTPTSPTNTQAVQESDFDVSNPGLGPSFTQLMYLGPPEFTGRESSSQLTTASGLNGLSKKALDPFINQGSPERAGVRSNVQDATPPQVAALANRITSLDPSKDVCKEMSPAGAALVPRAIEEMKQEEKAGKVPKGKRKLEKAFNDRFGKMQKIENHKEVMCALDKNPSFRNLIEAMNQESDEDRLSESRIEPSSPDTVIGALAGSEELKKPFSVLDIQHVFGPHEGNELLGQHYDHKSQGLCVKEEITGGTGGARGVWWRNASGEGLKFSSSFSLSLSPDQILQQFQSSRMVARQGNSDVVLKTNGDDWWTVSYERPSGLVRSLFPAFYVGTLNEERPHQVGPHKFSSEQIVERINKLLTSNATQSPSVNEPIMFALEEFCFIDIASEIGELNIPKGIYIKINYADVLKMIDLNTLATYLERVCSPECLVSIYKNLIGKNLVTEQGLASLESHAAPKGPFDRGLLSHKQALRVLAFDLSKKSVDKAGCESPLKACPSFD